MQARSVRRPLAAALLAGVIGVAVTAGLVIGSIYERATVAAGAEALRVSADMFHALQQGDVEKLTAAMDALLQDEQLRRAFVARDREALLAAAQPRLARLRDRDGISHWYFHLPDRTCFLRVHRPELHGDAILRASLAQAAATGAPQSGLDLGRTAFALRVVRPWVVDGALIGFVELAEDLGAFLSRAKAESGNDFGVLVKKKFLDADAWAERTGGSRDTWNARADVVVVDTTTFTSGIIDYQGDLEAVPDDGLVLGEQEERGRFYLRAIYPLPDSGGRKAGALFVLRDFTELHRAMAQGRQRTLLVVVGMALLACGGVWLLLEWLVLRHLPRD